MANEPEAEPEPLAPPIPKPQPVPAGAWPPMPDAIEPKR